MIEGKQHPILFSGAMVRAIPANTEIDGIELDFCQPDLVLVRIVGAGWPTGEGQTIVPTTATVIGDRIDWNLPDQKP